MDLLIDDMGKVTLTPMDIDPAGVFISSLAKHPTRFHEVTHIPWEVVKRFKPSVVANWIYACQKNRVSLPRKDVIDMLGQRALIVRAAIYYICGGFKHPAMVNQPKEFLSALDDKLVLRAWKFVKYGARDNLAPYLPYALLPVVITEKSDRPSNCPEEEWRKIVASRLSSNK